MPYLYIRQRLTCILTDINIYFKLVLGDKIVDVLLINPPYPSVVLRYVGAAPPIGLAYLASIAEQLGLTVEIIDYSIEKFSIDSLRYVISRKNPHIVGLTCTTPSYYNMCKIARNIKEILGRDVYVIVGGPHVTYTHVETLIENPFIDIVVRGEGEITFKEVCSKIIRGGSFDDVLGISYRGKNGSIKINPERPLIKNLDELPFPAWHLIKLEKYGYKGGKVSVPIMTSRGCPFNCIFCSSSKLMGKKFRARSPENVVSEIKYVIDRFGIRHFGFLDDIFTLDKKRAMKIADLIIENNLDIIWGCSSRVDTLDEQLLQKLREAGCKVIYIGVESGCQEVLNWYRKGITIEQAKNAVELCKKVGIECITTFILGAPIEDWYRIEKTIDFAIKLDPDYAQFTLLTPYPGTDLWEYAKQHNLIVETNFELYDTVHPVMRTHYLSAKDLGRALAKAYLKFYGRLKFFKREIFDKKRLAMIVSLGKGLILNFISYIKSLFHI